MSAWKRLDRVSDAICNEVAKRRDLLEQDASDAKSAAALIAAFRTEAVLERGYLTPGDLERIARLKNGGKLSGKTLVALRSNGEAALRQVTTLALKEDDPELAIRLLLGLDGVRLPTASCILAWTQPHRWAVIDVRSWNSICSLSGGEVKPLGSVGAKIDHWLDYVRIVGAASKKLSEHPQAIDVWLYRYDQLRS